MTRKNEQDGDSCRPRLLFLCHTLPYPTDLGVHIRTFHTLRLLSRQYEVTALCFYRHKDRPTDAHVKASLEALAKIVHRIEAFPIPQEHSRLRLFGDHLRSLVFRRAYTEYAYRSPQYQRRVEELVEQDFDLVHVDSLDLASYLPIVAGRPVVCAHHNVESELLRRRAATEGSALLRAYLRYQANRLEELERRYCGQVALNIAVSDDDRAGLAKISPKAKFEVVPNGVDTTEFQTSAGPGDGIVFVGGTHWFPNRDALDFFCDEILPRLRAAGCDAPVTWVGRASERAREHYRSKHGVELTGYVDDVRPYVYRAACYVVPLRVGGGTRLKVLDAWSSGKAVISTSVGCEGLQARDNQNILIRDDPADFASGICAVLRDEELRSRLGREARLTAEAIYDWEVIGESMLGMYREIVPTGGKRPTQN